MPKKYCDWNHYEFNSENILNEKTFYSTELHGEKIEAKEFYPGAPEEGFSFELCHRKLDKNFFILEEDFAEFENFCIAFLSYRKENKNNYKKEKK